MVYHEFYKWVTKQRSFKGGRFDSPILCADICMQLPFFVWYWKKTRFVNDVYINIGFNGNNLNGMNKHMWVKFHWKAVSLLYFCVYSLTKYLLCSQVGWSVQRYLKTINYDSNFFPKRCLEACWHGFLKSISVWPYYQVFHPYIHLLQPLQKYSGYSGWWNPKTIC